MYIGIRTVRPGEIRLKFSGTDRFDPGTFIYLHDLLSGLSVNLSETDEYVFEKRDRELYLENRFFLTFAQATDVRPSDAVGSNIVVHRLPGRSVRIASDNGSVPGRIQIADIRGKVLVSREVSGSSHEFQAPAPGVYIVRVGNATGTAVKKLVVSD